MTPCISRQSPLIRILLGFAGSVLLIFLSMAALALISGLTIDPAWNATAFASAGKPISPLNPAQTFSSAGLLFGLSAGYVSLTGRGGFSTGAGWRNRIAPCILALAAVFLLSAFVDGVIALSPRAAFTVLMYLKMTIVGLFIGCGIPLLLIRAGVREPENSQRP